MIPLESLWKFVFMEDKKGDDGSEADLLSSFNSIDREGSLGLLFVEDSIVIIFQASEYVWLVYKERYGFNSVSLEADIQSDRERNTHYIYMIRSGHVADVQSELFVDVFVREEWRVVFCLTALSPLGHNCVPKGIPDELSARFASRGFLTCFGD